MFVTELHDGQGLGNQLWVYAFTTTLAKERGAFFSIKNPERFKGLNFLNLDFGIPFNSEWHLPVFQELQHYDEILGAHIYNEIIINEIPELAFLKGNFQSVEFVSGNRREIEQWAKCLSPKNLEEVVNDKTCILNLRGGDYRNRDDLLLYPDYWRKAISHMRNTIGELEFKIVTDDFKTAKQILPEYEILKLDVHGDYFILQNAPYLILSNSSFAFFPAWTNRNLKYCLAPKFWAGHNRNRGWISRYNLVEDWNYISRTGEVSSGAELRKGLGDRPKNILHRKEDSFVQKIMSKASKPEFFESTWENWSFQVRNKITWAVKRTARIIKYKTIYELKKTKNRSLFLQKCLVQSRVFQNNHPLNRKDFIDIFSILKRTKRLKVGKRKVFDIIYFHNEIEILKLRLRILSEYVDYFVIVESKVSFLGEAKQPFARTICADFPNLSHKFIFIEVDRVPHSSLDAQKSLHSKTVQLGEKLINSRLLQSKNVPWSSGPSPWVREFYIKEYPSIALELVHDEDLVFISDVDEIWNPKSRFRIPNGNVQLLWQRSYHYFLNNRANESYRNWSGTVLVDGKTFKMHGPNLLRSHLNNGIKRKAIAYGGWHFTSQGPIELIKEKFKNPYWLDNEVDWETEIVRLVEEKVAYRGKQIKFKLTDRGLPEHLKLNREKYLHMFATNNSNH
jgi:hypothetical protein